MALQLQRCGEWSLEALPVVFEPRWGSNGKRALKFRVRAIISSNDSLRLGLVKTPESRNGSSMRSKSPAAERWKVSPNTNFVPAPRYSSLTRKTRRRRNELRMETRERVFLSISDWVNRRVTDPLVEIDPVTVSEAIVAQQKAQGQPIQELTEENTIDPTSTLATTGPSLFGYLPPGFPKGADKAAIAAGIVLLLAAFASAIIVALPRNRQYVPLAAGASAGAEKEAHNGSVTNGGARHKVEDGVATLQVLSGKSDQAVRAKPEWVPAMTSAASQTATPLKHTPQYTPEHKSPAPPKPSHSAAESKILAPPAGDKTEKLLPPSAGTAENILLPPSVKPTEKIVPAPSPSSGESPSRSSRSLEDTLVMSSLTLLKDNARADAVGQQFFPPAGESLQTPACEEEVGQPFYPPVGEEFQATAIKEEMPQHFYPSVGESFETPANEEEVVQPLYPPVGETFQTTAIEEEVSQPFYPPVEETFQMTSSEEEETISSNGGVKAPAPPQEVAAVLESSAVGEMVSSPLLEELTTEAGYATTSHEDPVGLGLLEEDSPQEYLLALEPVADSPISVLVVAESLEQQSEEISEGDEYILIGESDSLSAVREIPAPAEPIAALPAEAEAGIPVETIFGDDKSAAQPPTRELFPDKIDLICVSAQERISVGSTPTSEELLSEKAEEERRKEYKEALQKVLPVVSVGAGAVALSSFSGGSLFNGALEVVGALAAASFLTREVIWAGPRQQLLDEIRNIKSHKELLKFLKDKDIFP